ncbi:hypothetical protein [Bacillus amyloliquefaciens]|uniref:hypothetical protein n=1 Tax=Bacillus amyloliquefaciens TaxID=1390 RepID=UPI000DE45080|nr:hypothetical protein [Bacillus amyloliquefaciens]
MTEAEQDEMTAKALKEAEEIMDTFFGQGSFHPIYEACGKSMRNLYKFIEAVRFLGISKQGQSRKARILCDRK